MLFRSVCVLALAGSLPFASGQATYPRGAMWIFGSHGLSIYNTDGSKLLKAMPPEDFCPLNEEGQADCRSYNEIVSDYNKYAWTSADSRSGTNVEIFDLDNGDHVGSFPTCSGPRGFHFLPSRSEIWFRCTAPHAGDPDGESGYWDSFSTTSIGLDFPEISLNQALPHSEETSYGQPVFLEDRGIGYSSDNTFGVLHKVDLDARRPLSNMTIPDASGGWEITYSRTNEHIFLRTYVCCTCGGPDKDLETCVEYQGGVHADPVFILTGPSANPTETQLGACGRFCDNSLADVIGIAEIDTRTDTIVGYHKNGAGFGAASVYLSPDEVYVVLVSTLGAPANIRLLKPGVNGQLSTLFKDIPIPTEGRLGNHEFITSDLIAITGSDDKNEMFLVEISTGTIHTIQLDTSNVNTDNGRGRQMKYVPGSSYLWLSATGPEADADKFAYVVHLDFENWAATKVIRKVSSISVNGMLFVENMKLTHGGHQGYGGSSTVNAAITVGGRGSAHNNNDALSISALVFGVLAFMISVVGFVKASKKPRNIVAAAGGSKEETATAAHDDVEKHSGFEGSVDDHSMGSKRDQYA